MLVVERPEAMSEPPRTASRSTCCASRAPRPWTSRVVFDRNRVTGAGVSAGLDMGLAMVERLRDREHAQAVQLLADYAPQPPPDAGSPRTTPAPVRELLDKMFAGFVERTANALRSTAR